MTAFIEELLSISSILLNKVSYFVNAEFKKRQELKLHHREIESNFCAKIRNQKYDELYQKFEMNHRDLILIMLVLQTICPK